MSDVLKHSKRIEPNAEFLKITFLVKRPRGRPKKKNVGKLIAILKKGDLCSIE